MNVETWHNGALKEVVSFHRCWYRGNKFVVVTDWVILCFVPIVFYLTVASADCMAVLRVVILNELIHVHYGCFKVRFVGFISWRMVIADIVNLLIWDVWCFCRYICLVSLGAWYQRKYELAIFTTALSTFLSWPFAALIG